MLPHSGSMSDSIDDDIARSLDASVGTKAVAISYDVMDAATAVLAQHLPTETLHAMKLASGEHLAAMLATAYLQAVPVAVDVDGGVDLTFDLKASDGLHLRRKTLLGRDDAEFADFEVKSIPGTFREKYLPATTRAMERGEEQPPAHLAKAVPANNVIEASAAVIGKAAGQLRNKSSPDRARVAFIVSHFLDRPYVECFQPLISQALAPLDPPEGIDAVWMYFAPSHVLVWSAASGWSDLLLGSFAEEQIGPEHAYGMELLQHYEGLFLERAGIGKPSPFFYELTVSGTGEE
ncbi:hypothetical protein GCM10012286_23660 [Streptomyces lasiicapitis]|uniref:Uncharacterized protein n=2 Tax=Streptomyces lasiicapitis TaxID=1923961 RepID=A0ABQ2LS10_9ACTN|nr:hypothetical protein GCM10012286_23660 [Streptomyces lasiicapitis]